MSTGGERADILRGEIRRGRRDKEANGAGAGRGAEQHAMMTAYGIHVRTVAIEGRAFGEVGCLDHHVRGCYRPPGRHLYVCMYVCMRTHARIRESAVTDDFDEDDDDECVGTGCSDRCVLLA